MNKIQKLKKAIKETFSAKAASVVAIAIFSIPAFADLKANAFFYWQGDIPEHSMSGFYVHTDDFFGTVDVRDGVIENVKPLMFYVTPTAFEPTFDYNKTDGVHFSYTLLETEYVFTESVSTYSPFDVVTFDGDYASNAVIDQGVEYNHNVGTPMKLSVKVNEDHRELLVGTGGSGILKTTFLIKPNAVI